MDITQQTSNQVATLQLQGSFLYSNRKAFQEAIRKACLDGARQIVVDLSRVNTIDSAALGLLMVTHRQLCNDRRRLTLARAQENVRQIIELANLHHIIPLSDGTDVPAMRKTA